MSDLDLAFLKTWEGRTEEARDTVTPWLVQTPPPSPPAWFASIIEPATTSGTSIAWTPPPSVPAELAVTVVSVIVVVVEETVESQAYDPPERRRWISKPVL